MRREFEVCGLTRTEELVAAERLFTAIWSPDGSRVPVIAELLRAFEHSGNYVAGVFRDDQLIGASAAFAAVGQPALHSHITGVLPDAQNRGAGFALKQHQRAWALERGFDTITWTFDPLVRRNAYFNLVRLGARVTGYHTRMYGDMLDALNVGDDSDRCFVEWDLRADQRGIVDAAELTGDVTLVETPEVAEPRRAWRLAVREALGGALAEGFVAVGMTPAGEYILHRE